MMRDRGQEIGMRRKADRLAIAVCLLALGFTAAGALQAQRQTETKPENSNEPPALWREIHHQLLVLPFYSVFDHIEFTIKGPDIILSGQVLRPTLKENAEAVVRSLEGVTVVVNQIELLPNSPADDELRRDIYRAVYENPELARYAVEPVPSIHIIVKNGKVALEGTVDSAEHKSLAASRAGTVANVQGVRNNLIVRPHTSAGQ
jgi:hyperosmotically inducible periplasmic protein